MDSKHTLSNSVLRNMLHTMPVISEALTESLVRVYVCPRCKWRGTESETKPITKDGETAIDYADGSPIHGCPKCGEHKLKEL